MLSGEYQNPGNQSLMNALQVLEQYGIRYDKKAKTITGTSKAAQRARD
jgi:hypothetical protein